MKKTDFIFILFTNFCCTQCCMLKMKIGTNQGCHLICQTKNICVWPLSGCLLGKNGTKRKEQQSNKCKGKAQKITILKNVLVLMSSKCCVFVLYILYKCRNT